MSGGESIRLWWPNIGRTTGSLKPLSRYLKKLLYSVVYIVFSVMSENNEKGAFIGIDLGTSGCRAVAVDAAAELLSEVSVRLPGPHHRDQGVSEQDPELWWQAVCQVLSVLREELKQNRICGIAVDGTSSTLLAANSEGTPLGPALMYDDTRAVGVLPQIKAAAPKGSAVISAGSSLAKAIYIASALEQRGICHLLHQADWILGRLSGRFGVSDENNALKLGYDAVSRNWPDWVFRLGVPSAWFPTVYRPGTDIAPISDQIARKLGLDPTIRIIAGTTDSTAAALAAGLAEPGQALSCLGTTLVLKVLSVKPIFAPEFGVYSQRLDDLWLVGGASNSGGAVLEQFFNRKEMARLSKLIDPNRLTGLDYYPLSRSGERFPTNDPSLPPRLEPRPQDDGRFFQAILEGIARIERDGYRRLRDLGAPAPTQVTTIGGGAVNQPWRRLREKILGIPVATSAQQQAAYGTALLASAAGAKTTRAC